MVHCFSNPRKLLMQRADSLEKTLILGKIEGRRRRGQQRMRWLEWHLQLDGHESEQALGNGEDRGAWYAAARGVCMAELNMTERLNWTGETNTQMPLSFSSSLIVSTLTGNSCLLFFFLTHLLQPSSAQLKALPPEPSVNCIIKSALISDLSGFLSSAQLFHWIPLPHLYLYFVLNWPEIPCV